MFSLCFSSDLSTYVECCVIKIRKCYVIITAVMKLTSMLP